MPDANFPGDESQTGSTLEGPPGPPEAKPEEEEAGEAALLPKSMFGDVKPGQTITVKVKRIYEEEIEVEPVESGKEDAASMSGNPMDTARAEMEGMATAAEA